MIRTLLQSSWQRKGVIVLITLVRSVILLLTPLLIKVILTEILPQENRKLLIVICIIMVLIPIVTCGLIIVDLYLSSFVIENGYRLRKKLFQMLLQKPGITLTKEKLLHLILDESEDLVGRLFRGIGNFFWLCSTIIIGFSLMLALLPVVGCVVLVLSLGLNLLLYCRSKVLEQSNIELLEQLTAWNQLSDLIFRGKLSILNNYPFLTKMQNTWNKQAEKLRDTQKKINRQVAHIKLWQDIIQSLCLLTIFSSLFWQIDHSKTTLIANTVAVYQIYQWLIPAMEVLVMLLLDFRQIKPVVTRLEQLQQKLAQKQLTIKSRATAGELLPLEVQPGLLLISEKLFLESKFVLTKGEKIWFMGKSGSGKTTLLQAILQYPESETALQARIDKISFGGRSIELITRNEWQAKCVFLTQKIKLYYGTLRENICLERKVSAEKLQLIMELLHFSPELRLRLDEMVYPDQVNFSGGQRQQIGLARALVRNPEILVLDESTSALDRELEKQILQNIVRKFPGLTILFISHRNYDHQKLFTKKLEVVADGAKLCIKNRTKDLAK